MQSNTVYQSLSFEERRTWLLAALFTVGNIVAPQLCHLIPQGGLILLPIYFFTLIGAYKYGWRVGLLIAWASPLMNHLLFGMPPAAMLPVLLAKSTALALVAAFVAHRFQRATLTLLLLVVVGYQLLVVPPRPLSPAIFQHPCRTGNWAGPDCCFRLCSAGG